MSMHSTGEKPGTGVYTCTMCAQKVVLDDKSDNALNVKILIIVSKLVGSRFCLLSISFSFLPRNTHIHAFRKFPVLH